MDYASQPLDLNYGLPRAGPRWSKAKRIYNPSQSSLSQFDFASAPLKELEPLKIDEILAIEISEKAHEVYIETLSGSFTIEPSTQPIRVMLVYSVLLEMNCGVTKTSVIGFHEKEFREVVWKIEKYSFADVDFQKRVLEILNKPFWILREHVPTISGDLLRGKNSKECLDARYPGGRKRLIDLGFLSAIDMMFNNAYRLKNVSTHRGNFGNAKFEIRRTFDLKDKHVREPDGCSLEFGRLMTFSMNIEPINRSKSTQQLDRNDNYLMEVETLLETVCNDLRDVMEARVDPMMVSDHHWESMNRYTNFITHFTGYQFTTMAEFQILLGLIMGFQMLARFNINRIAKIMDMLVKKFDKIGGKEVWISDLESIHIQFFEEIIAKTDKILIRYDDVIAYCHTVTIGEYSLRFGDQNRLSKGLENDLRVRETLQEQYAEKKLKRKAEMVQVSQNFSNRMMADFGLDGSREGGMQDSLFANLDEIDNRVQKRLQQHFKEIDTKIEDDYGLKTIPVEVPSLTESRRYNNRAGRGDFMNDTLDQIVDELKSPKSILKSPKNLRSGMRSPSKVSFAKYPKEGDSVKSKRSETSKTSKKSGKKASKKPSKKDSKKSKKQKKEKSVNKSRSVERSKDRKSKKSKTKKSEKPKSRSRSKSGSKPLSKASKISKPSKIKKKSKKKTSKKQSENSEFQVRDSQFSQEYFQLNLN